MPFWSKKIWDLDGLLIWIRGLDLKNHGHQWLYMLGLLPNIGSGPKHYWQWLYAVLVLKTLESWMDCSFEYEARIPKTMAPGNCTLAFLPKIGINPHQCQGQFMVYWSFFGGGGFLIDCWFEWGREGTPKTMGAMPICFGNPQHSQR